MEKILFLTGDINRPGALLSNSLRRKKVLEKIGYQVELYPISENQSFLFTFISLLKKIENSNIIYIRLDGGGINDKYTLLKLFSLSKRVVWEIHGFKEEALEKSRDMRTLIDLKKNQIKRRLLSYLVDICIFVSEELYFYSKKKIYLRSYSIIPNFIDPSIFKNAKDEALKKAPVLRILEGPGLFKVLWAGDAYFKWQAIDLIERVARRIYEQDKEIIFVIVGSHKWYELSWCKNVVSLDSVSYDILHGIIKNADVCLALYNKSKFFPFYFYPLKILDYMSLAKPVIATEIGAIRKLVADGETGILVNNSEEIIVNTILKLKRNPQLRKRIGLAAKKYITTVGDRFAIKAYQKVFRKAN